MKTMGEVKPITVARGLNVPERIHMLSILPQEGDVTSLRIVRELRESLSLTEEEHREFGIETVQNGAQVTYRWKNADAALRPREFQFKPKALAVISETLKRLNNEKRLRAEWLPLYEAFVED
jgi:hypothetical protein